MGKNILVTGGAGFIGSHLIEDLILIGENVMVIDNLSSSTQANISKKVPFTSVDILDKKKLSKVFNDFKPQVIFHLAAIAQIGETNSSKMMKVNVEGTRNLLELSKKYKLDHFYFTSSAAVYGNVKNLPISENSPTKPISDYGKSKLQSESLIISSKIPSGIMRMSNVYGPRQSFSNAGGVVAIFFHQAINNKPMIIFGDGNQTRDFIYVRDVVSAFIKAYLQQKTGIYNISSNKVTIINNMVKQIKKITNSTSTIKHQHKRHGDIIHSLINNNTAKINLDWSPQFTLNKGLSNYYEYIQR